MLDKISKLFKKTEKPIEVFIRTCYYSTASAHKKRYPSFSREKCFENFISTVDLSQINLTIFLDTAYSQYAQKAPHFVHRHPFPVIEIQAGTEAASFLCMIDDVTRKKFPPETILYFLEDDYLHRPGWIQILKEGFTLPDVDYVTLYDHRDKYFFPQYQHLRSKIFHTQSCHWRTTPSTTNTYATRFKTLLKHLKTHRDFSLNRAVTADSDKFFQLAQEGATLISSIPGYATHAEPEFASPCTSWEAL